VRNRGADVFLHFSARSTSSAKTPGALARALGLLALDADVAAWCRAGVDALPAGAASVRAKAQAAA
jgi:hypothetical protein